MLSKYHKSVYIAPLLSITRNAFSSSPRGVVICGAAPFFFPLSRFGPGVSSEIPDVRVCALGLHRGSRHHAVHGHIHLPQGLALQDHSSAATTTTRGRTRAKHHSLCQSFFFFFFFVVVGYVFVLLFTVSPISAQVSLSTFFFSFFRPSWASLGLRSHLLFTSPGSHRQSRAFRPSWSWWRESEYPWHPYTVLDEDNLHLNLSAL